MSERVRLVRPGELRRADPAPGITLEEAGSAEGFWSGVGTIQPGTFSGWHHHGEWSTVAYVRRGSLRFESGPGGDDIVEAKVGDFIQIPAHAIHREGAPNDEQVEVVVFRIGRGDLIFNVEGPDAG